MLRVGIDPERCTGHGRCFAVAPDLFGPDDDGYGQPFAQAFADDLSEQAQLAVRNCPEDAVAIVGADDEGTP